MVPVEFRESRILSTFFETTMLKSGIPVLVLENGHLQGGGGHGSCVCM